MQEMTVRQFKKELDADSDLVLLDVREPFEQYQSNIKYKNKILIPLDRWENRLDEIEVEKSTKIVCMCRSGGRSVKASKLLEKPELTNVIILKG